MDRPGGRRLEAALDDFAEQHGVLSRAREQIRALSVTARSGDGVVEVTVNAEGRMAGIRFVGRRFREMTPGQLGESVMVALATARSEVVARTTAVVATASRRLPEALEAAASRAPASPGPARDAPAVCWRGFVREARAELTEPAGSRPQEPLWGPSRPRARCAAGHPPPFELREAVMALRAAVCLAVVEHRSSPACGCEAV
ncbi:YbaB/EbfC family nucleoid-associated protein [Streptomyces violaceorubidus]|uniref:YbaB/EbfC family nucleoid-associated protein n=1 Tax=Streptomyces violaceorubidus TaxID=284042 RepID=A0ABV1SUY0_9ACTN